MTDDYLVSIAVVAERFGVTTARIRQRDEEFKPRRRPNGARVYSVRRVEELLARKAG